MMEACFSPTKNPTSFVNSRLLLNGTSDKAY